ncbi:MAG: EscS/YscS/HrcS family type III secretion system export apparatus protein, partial [Thermodesulfatator sp.]
IGLLMAFPWMMNKMVDYTRDIIVNIPNFIR